MGVAQEGMEVQEEAAQFGAYLKHTFPLQVKGGS